MRRRPVVLDQYGIPRWEYKELEILCLHYEQKKHAAQNLLGISSQDLSGMPKGNKVGNPTEAAALKRMNYLRDVEIIEQAARETQNGIWYKALIENCCRGVGYDHLSPVLLPTSKRIAYFRARREFFWRLYHLKMGTSGDVIS